MLCACAWQVLLRLPEGDNNRAMVYASSWWDAAHVSEYLKDTSRPIWESLSQGRTELYRDIQQVYCGHSAYLEEWVPPLLDLLPFSPLYAFDSGYNWCLT